MKVALVHDWLTGMRGGEYVLEAIAELFPRSDLYTLLYVPGKIAPAITALRRHVSWLQKVPQAEKRYRGFLPFMPSMIESFDLKGYDLIVSSSHCVAKGVRKAPGAVHVSYVHAPMRYVWDRYDEYFGPGRASPPVRAGARFFRKRLQAWDRSVSGPDRIDTLVANSQFIADRIHDAYGRKAQVVYPFADLTRFTREHKAGKTYLMVTAFAPYKRVDMAIEAFNRLKLPLMIIGGGQDKGRLLKLAGPTVDLVGPLSNAAIADLYAKARGFIFPGKEDFGITPLEAMAAGTPVIAFGEGGAAETVTDKTGILFRPQTVEALMEAVQKIERHEVTFSDADCRARAAQFTRGRFQRELAEVIRSTWKAAGKDPAPLEERLRTGWAAAELGLAPTPT